MSDKLAAETTALQLREELGRKIQAEDVDADPGLTTLASGWLREWQGNFEFLNSVKDSLEKRGYVSAKQVAGVLNCMATNAEKPKQPMLPLEHPEVGRIPDGTYSVVEPDGSYTTIQLVKDTVRQNAPEGSQLARYLVGPDNTADYAGFAFVEGRKPIIWKRYRDNQRLAKALQTLLSKGEWRNAGEAYALRSGACWRCHRKLTTPISINRGLGPECASKVGVG